MQLRSINTLIFVLSCHWWGRHWCKFHVHIVYKSCQFLMAVVLFWKFWEASCFYIDVLFKVFLQTSRFEKTGFWKREFDGIISIRGWLLKAQWRSVTYIWITIVVRNFSFWVLSHSMKRIQFDNQLNCRFFEFYPDNYMFHSWFLSGLQSLLEKEVQIWLSRDFSGSKVWTGVDWFMIFLLAFLHPRINGKGSLHVWNKPRALGCKFHVCFNS